MTTTTGYDVIGDVHGMIQTLRSMVEELGYRQRGGRWYHPEQRQLVSVGDLLDRGPDPLGCLELVALMVKDGCAQMVLGNHELNAMHYQRGLRPATDKNTKQFASTLSQITARPDRWSRADAFLQTCPTHLLLDEGRLRVVHAYWDGLSKDLSPHVATDLPVHVDSAELWQATAPEGRYHAAVEACLKGPEKACAPFKDKSGQERTRRRIPWWTAYPNDAPLVAFGHYWFPWQGAEPSAEDPSFLGEGENAICLDYGVGIGGHLGALRYPERDQRIMACRDDLP